MSLVDRFNTAIQLWLDLTATDPNARSLSLHGWELRSINEEIKESMALDPSLITTFFLLSAFSKEYFAQRVFSAESISNDSEGVMAYMTKMRDFKAIIESPDIKIIGDNFQLSMRKAFIHYGVDLERIDALVSDLHELAFLRRDALRSIQNMRLNQFLKGERDSDIAPGYNPTLFQYWNINSLIEHACNMPAGIALSLVRDPDELHSYFCFTIRNGGNLYTMTDVAEYVHPLQRGMSRRPDREFNRRASRNWFPYDLLNIKYDEEGDPYHDKYRETKEQGLVPHQPAFYRYREVKDFEAGPLTWTLMMFDLIREKFWQQEIPQLPMSYTAEMIRLEDQTKILASAASANLPITGYEPISLQPLTLADVRTGALDEKAMGTVSNSLKDHFGTNQWMEDRYGDKVSPEVLNLLDSGEDKVLFVSDGKDDFQLVGDYASKALVVSGEIQKLAPNDYKGMTFFANHSAQRFYSLKSLDATNFGTREQLDADRKFLARYNYVMMLQREADREYTARKAEILDWFRERVEANMANLLPLTAEKEVIETRPFDGFAGPKTVKVRIAETHEIAKMESYDYVSMQVVLDGRMIDEDYSTCVLTGAKSTWRTHIVPRDANDLVMLTGVASIDDLPEVLRHWRRDEPYTGNHILNRIDPIEWAVSNPWRKMNFVVGIMLSKRGRNRIQKEANAKAAV